MVSNKKHFKNDHGFFYCGVNDAHRKFGRGKIGTSEQSNLNNRINVIKYKESDFTLCAFIRIEDCTKAELEFVESYTRMMLERQYQHTQNDHFEFEMNGKAEGYNTFIANALQYATAACNMQNFDYQVVYTKVYGKKMGRIEQAMADMMMK